MPAADRIRLSPWLAVALIVIATVLLRIHLLPTPLERDEGEYAYSGQLMLQGIPPYQLATNMKLPGTYAAYALAMAIFGQSTVAVHLGLLLVNAASILLIFVLGRRLYSPIAGVSAAGAYAMLSLGAGVLGTQAHATHFVVVFALAGLVMLLGPTVGTPLPYGRGSEGADFHLFAAGIFFGLAFLMKQHGIFFGIFGGAWLVATRQWKKLPAFAAGAATPFALTCVLLWRFGVFAKFWFWTVTYARHYVSETSIGEGAAALWQTLSPILWESAGLWILAAAGLAWALTRKQLFSPALLLFSFAATCPGLYFRAHYMVLILPAIALLAGSCVRGRRTAALLTLALVAALFTQREYLFRMTPTEVARSLYGADPFPEAIPVAAYIRQHSPPSARIAVLASEPEIYFYARRHSATSYLYTEPLVEPQPFALTMQNDMVREIEQAAPLYVVRFPIQETLSLAPNAPTRLFDWWAGYGPQHYQLVGIADILDGAPSEYHWEAAAETYKPQSLYHLELYRRK